jgi:excisionase family DNA binding protein
VQEPSLFESNENKSSITSSSLVDRAEQSKPDSIQHDPTLTPNETRGEKVKRSAIAHLFSTRSPQHTMNSNSGPVGALKIKDAAQYLGGVSTITVRRLIQRGLIKPNRGLRHILIPVSELDRFIQQGVTQ